MRMEVLKVRFILVPDSEQGWPIVSLLHTQEEQRHQRASEECFTFRIYNMSSTKRASSQHLVEQFRGLKRRAENRGVADPAGACILLAHTLHF